jgi:hypothetical protein
MAASRVSFTTFNLLNLNEPGLPIYTDADGWDAEVYRRKIEWTARALKIMSADVFGFQELWHTDSIRRAFETAGLADDYVILSPPDHRGGKIICAGAVRKSILVGAPEWIAAFPEEVRLESKGDDPQTGSINVKIGKFSRPLLSFRIKPEPKASEIHVYVCHFKSKGPTQVFKEAWHKAEPDKFKPHDEALGSALSTIRRTAEAAALRVMITKETKASDVPVVVIGDTNDGQNSNTLNILTGQPRYLTTLQSGGGDTDLYSAQTLQQYRSQTDVYYTHVFQDMRESLDHILFSEQFYDNSRKRVWSFDGMEIANDHLNVDDHKVSGTNDHGIVRVRFVHKPAPKKEA